MPRKSHFGIANPSELPTAQTAMQYGIGAAEKKGLLPGAGLQRRAVQMRGGGGGRELQNTGQGVDIRCQQTLQQVRDRPTSRGEDLLSFSRIFSLEMCTSFLLVHKYINILIKF